MSPEWSERNPGQASPSRADFAGAPSGLGFARSKGDSTDARTSAKPHRGRHRRRLRHRPRHRARLCRRGRAGPCARYQWRGGRQNGGRDTCRQRQGAALHPRRHRPPGLPRLAAQVASEIGPVSILVNNAGIIRRNAFAADADAVAKDWHDTLAVNLDGVFNVTRAFLDRCARPRGGSSTSPRSSHSCMCARRARRPTPPPSTPCSD